VRSDRSASPTVVPLFNASQCAPLRAPSARQTPVSSTRRAASAFQKIVDTKGSDISHLMTALGELKKAYGLQRTLILIVFFLFVAAVALGFVMALFGQGGILRF